MNYCETSKIAEVKCKGSQLIIPHDAEVLAPWVKMNIFGKGGLLITVGNESCKELKNTAAIKSFRYQFSNGANAEIEIIDEQGGSFSRVFQHALAKCMIDISEMYKVEVQFGWIGLGIDDRPRISPPQNAWSLYFIILNIDVQYGHGKIKYVLNCHDLLQASLTSRVHFTHQGTLRSAIQRLCTEVEPKFNVRFLSRPENGGAPIPFDFKHANASDPDEEMIGGGMLGIEGMEPRRYRAGDGPWWEYHGENENKLTILGKWLENHVTTNDNGFILQWDPTEREPTLIIWEDYTPKCLEEKPDCDSNNLGTFLVNAGKCSNVISFSPKINWHAAFAAKDVGGSSGSTMTSEPQPADDAVECGGRLVRTQTEETGITGIYPTPSGEMMMQYGEDAPKKTMEHNKANAKAGAIYEIIKPIDANLTIIGDPRFLFLDAKFLIGRTVSVIVLNPFSLDEDQSYRDPRFPRESFESEFGDWLAKPYINNILSNKHWVIIGVAHEIRDGKYTTTLNLMLPAPGIEPGYTRHLGGDPDAIEIDSCIREVEPIND